MEGGGKTQIAQESFCKVTGRLWNQAPKEIKCFQSLFWDVPSNFESCSGEDLKFVLPCCKNLVKIKL